MLRQTYQVYTDGFHNVQRLDLFEFDGTPVNAMYLVYQPPQMLPTSTLNPTNTASGTATATAKAKRTASAGNPKAKRGLQNEVPLNWKSKLSAGKSKDVVKNINADRLWWVGLAMTGVGGLLYLGPRRMGIQI